SSAAVYGNTEGLPKQVETFIDPESPYAVEKYAGEQYTKIYNTLYNLPTTALRFFNIYGQRQDPHSPYSDVLSIIDNKFKNNVRLTYYDDGEQTRYCVYEKDLEQALTTKFENEVTKDKI